MIIRKAEFHFNNEKNQLIAVIVLSVLLFLWQYYFINLGYNLELESIFGGTQVRMTWANALEVILIFFLIKEGVSFIESKKAKFSLRLLAGIIFIGKHSLYIFLYHMLFLDFYKKYFMIYSMWLNRGLCLLFIIGGPIILDYVTHKICSWVKGIMQEVKVDA